MMRWTCRRTGRRATSCRRHPSPSSPEAPATSGPRRRRRLSRRCCRARLLRSFRSRRLWPRRHLPRSRAARNTAPTAACADGSRSYSWANPQQLSPRRPRRRRKQLLHRRAAERIIIIARRLTARDVETAAGSIPDNRAAQRAVNAAVTAMVAAPRDAAMTDEIAIGVTTTTGIKRGASGIGMSARVRESLR